MEHEKEREQLFEWLKEICPWGKIYERCEISSDLIRSQGSPPEMTRTQVFIYTHHHRYNIVLKKNYFGCICSNRTPRAGEDWIRGRDLPDGDFNRKTWKEIKDAIIQNELVKIAKKARIDEETQETL